MPDPIATVDLKTWDEYLGVLSNHRSWIFRGETSATWKLQSSLDRTTPAGHPKIYAEHDLVHEFRRRAHTFLAPNEVPQADGEWLALMQHYGAPTRLLDFTKSPFVAAHFAFEGAAMGSLERCAIWAIEPGWCQTNFAYLALEQGGIFGLDRAQLLQLATDAERDAASSQRSPEQRRGWGLMMLGSVLAHMVNQHAMAHTPPIVCVFEPQRLSGRVAAQQGTFVWPGDVSLTVEGNLERMLALAKTRNQQVGVRKFTLPLSERGRVLDYLRLSNISETTLFPGLEGFARSLRTMFIRSQDGDSR